MKLGTNSEKISRSGKSQEIDEAVRVLGGRGGGAREATTTCFVNVFFSLQFARGQYYVKRTLRTQTPATQAINIHVYVMVIELSGVKFNWSEIISVKSKFEITTMISDQNCTTRSSFATLLGPF